MSEQKMKKSRSWSSYCRKEPGSCYKRQLRMRLSTISNSTRTDGMKMDGGWWSAMDICRSGRWSVEWVRSGFVSHECGIATRVAFPVRFCQVYASVSQRGCFDSSPLPQRDLDRRFQRSVDRDFGPRSQWAFSHQHRQTQKQLGSRLQGMESA